MQLRIQERRAARDCMESTIQSALGQFNSINDPIKGFHSAMQADVDSCFQNPQNSFNPYPSRSSGAFSPLGGFQPPRPPMGMGRPPQGGQNQGRQNQQSSCQPTDEERQCIVNAIRSQQNQQGGADRVFNHGPSQTRNPFLLGQSRPVSVFSSGQRQQPQQQRGGGPPPFLLANIGKIKECRE